MSMIISSLLSAVWNSGNHIHTHFKNHSFSFLFISISMTPSMSRLHCNSVLLFGTVSQNYAHTLSFPVISISFLLLSMLRTVKHSVNLFADPVFTTLFHLIWLCGFWRTIPSIFNWFRWVLHESLKQIQGKVSFFLCTEFVIGFVFKNMSFETLHDNLVECLFSERNKGAVHAQSRET